MADDFYATWYADRLWRLIPAVYRSLDQGPITDTPGNPTPGPLRALVARIGAQAALIRRDIDRLARNQSIETADDWMIPYIGDLLATRLVAVMDARAQRLDVARTIYYRRRAGTVGVIEELASNVAGHDARAVEFFRRLGRTRHQFDPPIGDVPRTPGEQARRVPAVVEGLAGAFSRSQAGGFADLRNAYAASNAAGPFDEFFHTADVRRGAQSQGWHNIPRLGVFVWFLYTFPIEAATPVERTGCPGQFTFDPTGRDIPLFCPTSRTKEDFGEHWVTPQEWDLPVPIRRSLWAEVPEELYPHAMMVGLGGGTAPFPVDRTDLSIDPQDGRFRFLAGRPAGEILVNYHFGFAGKLGAGGHDPRILPRLAEPAAEVAVAGGAGLSAALAAVAADTTVVIDDSRTYAGPAAGLTVPAGTTLALRSQSGRRPVVRWAAPAIWDIAGSNGANLTIQGIHLQGADIRLTGAFDTVRLRLATLDPGTSGAGDTPATVFRSTIDGLDQRPVHLFVAATLRQLVIERCITGPIRTVDGGAIETLTISNSIVQSIPTGPALTIFDPADIAARVRTGTDPLSVALRGALASEQLAALNALHIGTAPDAGLLAALQTALAAQDASALRQRYPLALADLALGTSSGDVSLIRTTVLGPSFTHRLAASESIIDEIAVVEDPQHGCVRFTTYADGSTLHAPYRSVRVPPAGPIVVTRLFGRPGYARLRRDADASIIAGGPHDTILNGAESGSETGAFSSESVSLKKIGLAKKLVEFMPVGVAPVLIDAD